MGFEDPKENWSKLPHSFIESLPLVETVGEMKVILYILRHTWGFQDDDKKITLDEFEKGRKKKDGTRLDTGTGLSIPTISDGLKRAEEHGFIEVEVDDSDKGRVKRFYSLKLKDQGKRIFHPDKKNLSSRGKGTLPRSEKDTPDRYPGKDTSERVCSATAELPLMPELPTEEPAPVKENPLAPSSPGAVRVFARLAASAAGRGWRGPRQFQTAEAKAAFEIAEAGLGVDATDGAVAKLLEGGYKSIGAIVAHLKAVAEAKRLQVSCPEEWKAVQEAVRLRPDVSNGHLEDAATICNWAINGGYDWRQIADAGRFWWAENWHGKKGEAPKPDQFLQILEIRRKAKEEDAKRWTTVSA